MYEISEAAKKLNVSVKTLQRWDRDGKLVAQRTPSNRRYYTDEQINSILQQNPDTVYVEIRDRYADMESKGFKFSYPNIMGHIIYTYCAERNINKDAVYDKTEIDGINIATCIVLDMAIIAVPLEADATKILDKYLESTKIKKGIAVRGTAWITSDNDMFDFKTNTDSKSFSEKFIK